MYSPFKIVAAIIFFLPLLCFDASLLTASPDTLKTVFPDTTKIADHDSANSSIISTSAKIDTLINKNEPPVFINKFSKFKRLFDKITTTAGDTLTVLVNKINESTVEFNFPLNHRKEILQKKLITSLIYSDGTIEIIPQSANIKSEKPESPKFSDKDWDKVLVVISLDDASGAVDLGEIESRFEGDRITVNSAYLEKSAMILLKKKAARLGANLIYVSKRDEYRAYGELPNMLIHARAFMKP